MDTAQFKRTMDDFLRTLRETPPAPGHARVLFPGLPESEEEIIRAESGIPFHPEVIEWFKDITSELDIPYNLT